MRSTSNTATNMNPSRSGVDLYGASYRNFTHQLYADIRNEAFGEDIGQTSWLTAEEQDLFIDWLGLSEASNLLDVACGSGKPTLRIAQRIRCHVCGIDLHTEGIASANVSAKELGLEQRAQFLQANAAEPHPFEDLSFDAITCIDAINHLPNRPSVLAEWRRILKPSGRLLFTDPIVLTGPMTNAEIATRASVGVFVFVPAGLDEALLKKAGFEVERVQDRTENMAQNAAGWCNARAKREADLRAIEGDETFEGQQRFLKTAAALAKERRLSRFAILARKPL
jgi:cyclopropane fatty-acyl-phospholipid synthase-like methyltransferase